MHLGGANVLLFSPMSELPNRIRELRKAKGMYLEHLAARVGCGVTQLSDLERGNRPLTYDWMKRVARALKVQPADLLSEKDNSRSLSAGEQELVRIYDRATDAQRDQLLQMARIIVAPGKAANAA